MPFSTPVKRELYHHRTVDCKGYKREDGLWDIEGYLLDTKSYTIQNRDRGGQIAAGEPIHAMGLRITLDEDLHIHAVEAVISESPFNICPRIVGSFKALEGLKIGPGWTLKTKAMFAGSKGCSHLTELLGPIATTAIQAIWGGASSQSDDGVRAPGEKPFMLDTCHSLASDGEVVRDFWPEFYKGTDPVEVEPAKKSQPAE